MDDLIEALEDTDGLPKLHRLAMLITAVAVSFVASDVTKKVYVGVYHKLHTK